MVRVLRMVSVAALLALALQPGGLPGVRPVSPVVATSGGCSPASSTCYLFDVHLGSGPGVGTGFGTYRSMGEDGTYAGRINCHYGNETQTGVCGWGYDSPTAGDQVDIFYLVSPDPGSQACDSVQCYSDDFTADRVITGNYAENEWHFELIQHFQIDVALTGAGSGTVTSNPPGIDCPGDCDDLYAANNPVVLTAKAKAGSVFGGWSGDSCTGTSATCVINTDFLQSVTARFNKKATAPPATAPPTKAPAVTPAAEITPEPTAEPSASVEPLPTVTASAAPTSDATPAATAGPSDPADSGGGNTPVIVGLAILLVGLVAGALFFARRGGAGAS